jgi:NTE family protein
MLTRPDILVLGGGGVLGQSWMMGVLAGIEDATGIDLRRCDYFVGTSAGSIVCAHLVSGRSPDRPPTTGTGLELASNGDSHGFAATARQAARRAGAWAMAAGSPLAPMALGLAAPGGALLRAAVLRTVPAQHGSLQELREEIDGRGVSFDGRLRIVAVDRRSGRRVVFGRPRSPRATVGQAVEASCTVPWLFAPVRIGARDYVDGGVWSPTNLDAAPAGRGTHVLCLHPLATITANHSLIALARGAARPSVSLEVLAVRRRGADVQTVAPDHQSAAAMGSDLMNREPRGRVLAAGYRQGLELAAAR